MRPRGVLKEHAPGTVATGTVGRCKSCSQPNTGLYQRRQAQNQANAETSSGQRPERPATPQEIDSAVLGLEAFMARRHRRVGPEKTSPIVWRRYA
ncbi:hypothetical protein V6N00_13355 [Tersicoccus sp. MR15.9]|uniref:hypothetical protein n=1 Tax=Tersicoccus mangrovi TaxID=3121635 RepID=UPI002FE68020